jgi:hypothetical protein
MVLGGAAAAIHGHGIIMVERGWTLVIAGSIVASSGAILAGLAHLSQRIAAIQRDTDRLRERFGRLDPASLPAPPNASSTTLDPAPRGPLDLPGTPPDVTPEPRRDTPAPAAPEPRSPSRVRPTIEGAPAPVLSDVPLRGTTTSVDRPEQRPAPSDAAEPSPDLAVNATVVGTYDSGGNHYVMFSDGSIEAETPNGVFRFGSLDELKDFIASGGESGAGAA